MYIIKRGQTTVDYIYITPLHIIGKKLPLNRSVRYLYKDNSLQLRSVRLWKLLLVGGRRWCRRELGEQILLNGFTSLLHSSGYEIGPINRSV